MSKILTLNDISLDNVDELLSKDIIIYEDIQGSKIWVNYNGTEFIIKSKSLNTEPLNLIDLSLQNYYNNAVNYLNSLDDRVRSLLNKSWWFCFEYFPDENPANINYSKIPKNGLILTTICKSGKYAQNNEELTEYARLFDVDSLPIIFDGVLNEEQIEAFKYFISTSVDDLQYVFGEKSFSYFFYKLLNPAVSNSFLMINGEYQDNLEKLLIKTSDGNISFQLLNPLYQKLSHENKTEFVEIYTLILVNFLNFCQSIDIETLKIKGEKRDDIYINLICKLFNIYIEDVKDDLLNFEFVIPQFFNKDKFKINKDLIPDKLTLEYINESEKLEYIFKCILSSFSKKRKNPIGVFTDNTIILFNNFVDKLYIIIDNLMNKKREIQINKSKLLDFGQYFEIDYEVDGDNQVYPMPDIFDDFEKSSSKDKKDKKGKLEYTTPDKKAI